MKLTGKQCKASRALLKWNLHDLSSRTHVLTKRIDSFEKGMCHLYPGENTELIEIFKKSGVEFLSDFEVCLADDVLVSNTPMVAPDGANVTITADDLIERPPVYVATDQYVGPDRRGGDRRATPRDDSNDRRKSRGPAPDDKK